MLLPPHWGQVTTLCSCDLIGMLAAVRTAAFGSLRGGIGTGREHRHRNQSGQEFRLHGPTPLLTKVNTGEAGKLEGGTFPPFLNFSGVVALEAGARSSRLA